MGYCITGTAVSFENDIIRAAMNRDDVITAHLFWIQEDARKRRGTP